MQFLLNVGLGYLTLNRPSNTLSGGESQRINLTTSLGSSLVGSLYILDEPSIGLHQRDNDKLLTSLRNLTDIGNTLIVVEHDEDTMKVADYIVDIGPNAGLYGGEIVACGSIDDIKKCEQDPKKHLHINEDVKRFIDESKNIKYKYTPLAQRRDRPDAIAWILRF